MIVLLERGADRDEVDGILERMRALGLAGAVLEVGSWRLIHLTQGNTRRARRLLSVPGVQAIVPTSGPRVRRDGRRFYPFHALCSGAVGLVLVGLLVFLAGFFPPGVSEALAPGATPPSPAWPWFLAPARGVLALVPERPLWIGPSLLVALGVLVLGLPLLDRSRATSLRERGPVLLVGALALASALALGLLGGNA